jgi:hypothetical protein
MAESRAELLARAVEIRDEHRTNANTPMRVGGALYQMVSSMHIVEFDVTAGPYLADPTGATDSSEAFLDAMEAASTVRGKVIVPRGTYMLSDQLLLDDGCYLNMELQDATLDFSTATGITARDACINIGTATANTSTSSAGLTLLPALGANANANDQQVTFLTAPTLSAGDLFIIQNTDNYSWNNNLIDNRPYYKAGDFLRARNVSGSVVQIDTQLYDTYLLSGNISLWRLQPNYAWIYGVGKIICPDHLTAGIHYNNVYRGLIRDIRIENCGQTAVEFWRCYETIADNVHTEAIWEEAPVAIGDAVSIGAAMNASYDCWLRGGSYKADKHGLTITGGNIAASIPSRRCGAIETTLRADTDAGDMHGHCEHCAFIDCQIDGGVRLGSDHSTLEGGTVITSGDIYEQGLSGLGVGLRECKGCSHTIRNVTLVVNQIRDADTYPIDLNTWEAVRGGKIVVENVTIRSSVDNPLVINLEITEHEDLMEVAIDGITYQGPSGAKAPAIRLNTGATGAFKDVVIENTKGLSIQTDYVRTRRLAIRRFDVSESDSSGIIAALKQYVGVTQVIEIIDGVTSGNDESGIYIDGADLTYDIYATVKGVRSINNGQDSGAAGSARVSLRVNNLQSLEITGNTWGDTQTVATQVGLLSVDQYGTIFGGPNHTTGSINYGTDANARSIGSVGNDLEIIELRGTGSPEASAFGSPGWTYARADGTKWLKASGSATNTGWLQAPATTLPGPLLFVSGTATIASGVITPTTSLVKVATEGAAATDDLVTINVGSIPLGLFFLQMATFGQDVVVKHGTGNIFLQSGADFTLSNPADMLLCFNSAGSVLVVVAVNF